MKINYKTSRNTIKKIVDENTIKEITTAKLLDLPFKKLNPEEDKKWNARKINSELLQAIEQGEDIKTMSERFLKIKGINETSAMRNARTMATSFENLGRLDGMKKMKENGTILKKKWLATISTKKHPTREWHQALSGQIAEIDEPFINYPNGKDKEEIMYPGDPTASPANIYNCRCTLIYEIEGFEPSQNYDVYVYSEGEENRIHYVDSSANIKEIKTLDGRIIKLNKPLKYGSLDRNIDKETRAEFEKFEYKYLSKGGGVEHEMSKGNIKIDARTRKISYDLNFAKGAEHSVKHMRGDFITHIHPRKNDVLGGTFSESDLRNLINDGGRTIRAVAQEGTYSFSVGREFKSYDFETEFLNKLEKGHQKFLKKYKGEVPSKQMNNYLIERHNLLLENQKKYGYFYTLEMRGGLK